INGYTLESTGIETCGGFLGEDQPEHVLEVSHAMNLKLVLQTDQPLTMALEMPDGELVCWDQDSTNNANVSLHRSLQPGSYPLWVGSREQSRSDAYRLVLSE
ncbi:MAG: hypothetical protein KC561_16905, partial [Myxococcales bacterium]|nr:hypothetical protein [Myxococcales bacterium]